MEQTKKDRIIIDLICSLYDEIKVQEQCADENANDAKEFEKKALKYKNIMLSNEKTNDALREKNNALRNENYELKKEIEVLKAQLKALTVNDIEEVQ